jgi:hypothetical protein
VLATLRHYKLNARSADILLSATESLFGWTQSSLLEDLAFWNKKGEWWLATIAHEGYGFIRPEQIDLVKLSAAVPGLMQPIPGATIAPRLTDSAPAPAARPKRTALR